jgi:dGTP triphosphohydrolase
VSLNKLKQLKAYASKKAYRHSEVEKTNSQGTVMLANWIRALINYMESLYFKKKQDLMKVNHPKVVAPN